MADGRIYKGDIGATIGLDSGVVLTGYSVLKIKYFPPDGSGPGEWTATVDPLDDSIALFTTQLETDLFAHGEWEGEIYAELSDGWKGHGLRVKFRIYEPIEIN